MYIGFWVSEQRIYLKCHTDVLAFKQMDVQTYIIKYVCENIHTYTHIYTVYLYMNRNADRAITLKHQQYIFFFLFGSCHLPSL